MDKIKRVILLEIQDFELNLNDLRVLHFGSYLQNVLALVDKSSRKDETAVVPIIFQFSEQQEKHSCCLSQLFKKEPLGIKFSSKELVHEIVTNCLEEKKYISIRKTIQTLQKFVGCMDKDIYTVCNLSSQYHFQMALEDKPHSSLCCLQACTSSFQVKGNYMDFMVESMYQKLVDKVIGSDNATTRKLAESKFHLLFYAVKKTKKLDLDQQCESNETGIHLQYSIARIEGIKKYLESDQAFMESDKCVSKSDLDALFEQFPKSSVLFNMLEIFEEKLLQSIFEPSLLVSYASSLSKLISSLYYHLRIKGEDVDTQKVRWFLFEKSFSILSTILNILHVEPVKKI